MSDAKTRLKKIKAYIAALRGAPLRLLTRGENGEETVMSVSEYASSNSTFVRVVGGNSLEDFDAFLQEEKRRIYSERTES